MNLRYFDDLSEGDQLACEPVAFNREEILEFGERFDPQIFHISEAEAEKSIFKGLVASSLHSISACTKAVVQALGCLHILSGVNIHEVRMFNPVRPGDVLTIKAWWADLRRSRSRPDRGFASVMCEVANQRGEPVLAYGYRYLIACKGFAHNP